VSSLVRTCAVCAVFGCAALGARSDAAVSDADAAPDQHADSVHGLTRPARPSCDDPRRPYRAPEHRHLGEVRAGQGGFVQLTSFSLQELSESRLEGIVIEPSA
jgi:hypothetical protein